MPASRISFVTAESREGVIYLQWLKGTQPFLDQSRDKTAEQPWSFRIYRREEPAFDRNNDRQEYFNCQSGTEASNSLKDARLIFEGELTPGNGRKFGWTDISAQFRTTYGYFIQPTSPEVGPCVGPIAVRGVDPEIYWSGQRLVEELESLAASSGGLATVAPCGFSGAGRQLHCLRIGNRGRRLALIGLIHPGESGPELIVPALRSLLRTRPALFEKAQIVTIPAVNVDGRRQVSTGTPWYVRTTPGGVDLNRNFPADWETVGLRYGLNTSDPHSITYRGESAGSAHETRAVMETLRRFPPDCLMSYHALASICTLPALSAQASADDVDYQKRCRKFVEAMGKGFFPGEPYAEKWLNAACASGSLPLWVYRQFNVPAFDMEFISHDKTEHPAICSDRTTREMLARYQSLHTNAIAAVLESLAYEDAGTPAHEA